MRTDPVQEAGGVNLTYAEIEELGALITASRDQSLDAVLVSLIGWACDIVTARTNPFVVWLVEEIHYPYDLAFPENPPPVDHALIAEHWRKWDGWADVSPEEAREAIRDEAGA